MLSSCEDLTTIVDNKIFPLVAENGTTFPFIVYKRTSVNPSDSKDKMIYKEEAFVEIMIASDKYNQSVEIADIVKDHLQG